MKKVAVIVLAFALFMMAFTVAPVMAKAEKVSVAGLSVITGGELPDDFRAWETEGGTVHARGGIAISISRYWIGVSSVPNPAVNPTYVFAVRSDVSSNNNEKTERGVSLWKSVMSYPATGTVQGTFEGVMHVEGDGSLTTMHVVYQGTGMFEGQTMVVSGTKQSGQPGVIEGFLLTR